MFIHSKGKYLHFSIINFTSWIIYRQSMKLQYEILVLGLKSGIDNINKKKQLQNTS